MNLSLFSDPLYRETIYLILGFLAVTGFCLFFLKKRHPTLTASWASVQSWLIAAPIILVAFALNWPWPLILVGFCAFWGTRIFFQMTGMFHRSNFVWISYLCLGVSIYFIHIGWIEFFNVMPVVMLLLACFVPLLRNSYQHMVQYISLALLNFCFMWGFIHLGLIMKIHPESYTGIYTTLYIIILTEFFDNTYLVISRFSKRIKLVSNITSRRSLEGFIIAGCLTILLAWGLRHLLPIRSEIYWLVVGFCCILFGSTGDSILAVIRRDLGIRHMNAFIFGRGDFYSRLERLIFVAPTVYYALILLERWQ